jgi:hypothetical protein
MPINFLDYRGGCLNGLAHGIGRATIQFPQHTGNEIFFVEGEFREGRAQGNVLITTKSGRFGYSGTVNNWTEQDGKGHRFDNTSNRYLTFRGGQVVAQQSNSHGTVPAQGNALGELISSLAQLKAARSRTAPPADSSRGAVEGPKPMSEWNKIGGSAPVPASVWANAPQGPKPMAVWNKIGGSAPVPAQVWGNAPSGPKPMAEWEKAGGSRPISAEEWANAPQGPKGMQEWNRIGGSAPAAATTWANSPSGPKAMGDWNKAGGRAPVSAEEWVNAPDGPKGMPEWNKIGGSAPVAASTWVNSAQGPKQMAEWDKVGGSRPIAAEEWSNAPNGPKPMADWEKAGGSRAISAEEWVNAPQGPKGQQEWNKIGGQTPIAASTWANSAQGPKPMAEWDKAGGRRPILSQEWLNAPDGPKSIEEWDNMPIPSGVWESSPGGPKSMAEWDKVGGSSPIAANRWANSPNGPGSMTEWSKAGGSRPISAEEWANAPQGPKGMQEWDRIGGNAPKPSSSAQVGGDGADTRLKPASTATANTEKSPLSQWWSEVKANFRTPSVNTIEGASSRTSAASPTSQAPPRLQSILPNLYPGELNATSKSILDQIIGESNKARSAGDDAGAKALLATLPDKLRGYATEAVYGSARPVDVTKPFEPIETALSLHPAAGAGVRATRLAEQVGPALRAIFIKADGQYIGRRVGSAGEEVLTVTRSEFAKIKVAILELKPIRVEDPRYEGSWFKLPDGSRIGFRKSAKHGETIDVDSPHLTPGLKFHQE